MKKIIITILLLVSCAWLIAQTGTGWAQMRAKYNFKDSINIANGWMINGTIILPSAAEINYVDGVTSAIQTQINLKANLASPNFSGVPTAPTAADGTNSTQIATTAFVESGFGTVAELAAQKYFDYDYYVEEVAGTVYARRSPNTSLTSYSGATFSGVMNAAMAEVGDGGKFYIAAGQYDDNDSIRFPNHNIIWQGAGMFKTVIKLKANYDAAKSMYGGYGFIAALSKNGVQIRDLQVDGNAANQTYIDDGDPAAIVARITGINMFGTSSNYLIERVYVHDVTEVGIKLWGSYGTLKDSYLVDCYHNGFTINAGGFAGGGSGYVVAENCIIRGGGDVGGTMYGTHNVIRGCTAIDINGAFGSTSTFAGFGIEGSGPTMTHDLVIEDCNIFGDCLYGIFSYQYAKGSVIQNNRISGFSKTGAHGIDITNGYGQKILGNYIHDFTLASNGIVLLGDTLSTVQGNKVLGMATANSYGINLNDSYMDVISENDVTTAGGGAGIIVQAGSNYNILDNNKAKGVSGLHIEADADSNKVINNIFTGSTAAYDLWDEGTDNKKNYNYGITTADWLNTDGLFTSLEIGSQASNTMVKQDSISKFASLGTNILVPFIGPDTAMYHIRFDMRENVEDYFPELADTVPLFVFGGGGGNNTDTTAFTTSTIYGSFYLSGSDTIAVTELRVVLGAGETPLGTDTLSVDILWDVNFNDGTPTELNTNPFGCNSTTTGTVDASFNNAKIPPGVWVWCETPGVVLGRKPEYMSAVLSGYKIPKY